MNNNLIYGKDPTERIVSIEVHDGEVVLFKEAPDGTVETETRPYSYWMLSPKKLDSEWVKIDGNLHYQYALEFASKQEFMFARRIYKEDGVFSVWNPKEGAMLVDGYTYFKGMKHKEVSCLAFDIETTSLKHNDQAKILLIANTLRKGGKIVRKLFAYDDYPTQGKLLQAWCQWVQEVDPSILLGHNILMYDLPYMRFIAQREGIKLRLGRDGNEIEFEDFMESKFRKDASQFYHYHRVKCYGREVIDTMFLSIRYDVGRKYSSYGLKSIIAEEGLEKKGRVFFDAGQIRFKYQDPIEWEKIKQYANDDGDDALALYDLMAPSFFYLAQSVPKTFQQIVETASGSQINSVMLRSYLQDLHSIPLGSEGKEYEGAISFGNPGIYHNVFKIDVASLYPSIMIQYEVYDKDKDPKRYFLDLVKTFTKRRLEHKKLAKTDKYYDDLQNAEKIFINSCYGFLGTPRLHFNSPDGAAFITQTGREILKRTVDWATAKGFKIVNADTDSISFCLPEFGEISTEERISLLAEINALFPDKIKFEDDGYYKTIIVVRAKNYILFDGQKVKHKGSALKATTKETALREFIKELLNSMLHAKNDFKEIYDKYAKEIVDVKDISRWATKKTITSKILKPVRTNEKKVLKALGNKDFMEGDKAYMFYKQDGTLSLVEDFTSDYDRMCLLKKLHKTTKTFENVLDVKTLFPNYGLKRNQGILDTLINGPE